MSLAIVKSPQLSVDRIALMDDKVAAPARPSEQAMRDEMMAELKLELQAQYDAKWAEAKQAAYEEGFAKGMTEGHEEGVKLGQEALAGQAAKLDAAISEVQTQAKAWGEQCERWVGQLAFEAVALMVGESALDPAFIGGMVERVTAPLREMDVVEIRMHPRECDVFKRALRQEGVASGASLRLADKLIADESLKAGGLVVETVRGTYSAPLDVQLTKLYEALSQVRLQSTDATLPGVRNVRVV